MCDVYIQTCATQDFKHSRRFDISHNKWNYIFLFLNKQAKITSFHFSFHLSVCAFFFRNFSSRPFRSFAGVCLIFGVIRLWLCLATFFFFFSTTNCVREWRDQVSVCTHCFVFRVLRLMDFRFKVSTSVVNIDGRAIPASKYRHWSVVGRAEGVKKTKTKRFDESTRRWKEMNSSLWRHNECSWHETEFKIKKKSKRNSSEIVDFVSSAERRRHSCSEASVAIECAASGWYEGDWINSESDK